MCYCTEYLESVGHRVNSVKYIHTYLFAFHRIFTDMETVIIIIIHKAEESSTFDIAQLTSKIQ
jgi:hypothetical protein